MWCASRRPPLGVCLFLSLFAVSRRFSLQPSCHLAIAPFSSCSPLWLSLLPLKSKKENRQPKGGILPLDRVGLREILFTEKDLCKFFLP